MATAAGMSTAALAVEAADGDAWHVISTTRTTGRVAYGGVLRVTSTPQVTAAATDGGEWCVVEEAPDRAGKTANSIKLVAYH